MDSENKCTLLRAFTYTVVEMGHNPMLSYFGAHYSTLNPISLHRKMLLFDNNKQARNNTFSTQRLLNCIGFSRFRLLQYTTIGAQKAKISKKRVKETTGFEQWPILGWAKMQSDWPRKKRDGNGSPERVGNYYTYAWEGSRTFLLHGLVVT